ncbi:MAG: ABC transporter permease [Pseudomonadota bacterium]
MPPSRAALARLFDAESALAVQLGRIALAVVVLALWELGSGRLFDPFYFSRPSALIVQFGDELVDHGFYRDLGVTALEMALGYGFGAVSGIAGGVLLARWAYVARLFDPFLLALNSIPRIAVAPMLIVWFGIDLASKVFLAATLVFFITFFNTLSGIRGVDIALCNVARVQGASEWQIFTKVMLPSASSWILTGLKMSLPFALVGVILGEFLVSSEGARLSAQLVLDLVQHDRRADHDRDHDADHDAAHDRGRSSRGPRAALAVPAQPRPRQSQGLDSACVRRHRDRWRTTSRSGRAAAA